MTMITKLKKTRQQRYRKCFKCIALLLGALTVALYYVNDAKNNFEDAKSNEQKKPISASLVIPKESELCGASELQVSSKVKPREEWNKSLWFVQLHNSVDGSMYSDLVNYLTLLPNGAKSFYASRRGILRHCIGDTETASCAIGGVPTQNLDSYSNKYMMLIRNPTTVLPYSANIKYHRYHGLEGQMTVEFWKKLCDDWLENMMNEWLDQIKDWRKSSYFELGLYIVFEDLMDPVKGPDVLREMAKVFQDIGFDTLDDSQIPCVWVKSLGYDSILQYHLKGYEFNDHIPGYTIKHKEYIIEKLIDLMTEVGDNDKVLTTILKRYIDDIRVNTVIYEG